MAGISTGEIDRFIKGRPAMKRNQCGTYAIDQLVDDFAQCTSCVQDKVVKSKLPFAVVNTDPIADSGTHWISFIRLQDGSFFLFDSFGLVGFERFVQTDDGNLLALFLSHFNPEKQGGVSFYLFNFDAGAFLNRLSKTCRGMMTFFTAFAVTLNEATIRVNGIIDQLQVSTTSTCVGFVPPLSRASLRE